MEEELHLIDNSRVIRLDRYLNYHISTFVLYMLSFYVFMFLYLAFAAAMVFSVFMLWVLWKEDRKGWIILYFIIVGLPFCFLTGIAVFYSYSRILLFASIAPSYLYFFLLRFDVNDWVKEKRAHNQYLMEKRDSENKFKSFGGDSE